jgi:hypothetical protein
MIVASIVIFLATTSVLYFRWATMTEPSCVIVIACGPAWRDAQIKVDGLTLTGGALKSTVVEGHYVVPFYLDPGEYVVTISLADELQRRYNIALKRYQQADIDLTKERPSATGTTLPAATPF